jgi:hypothetical protein
VQWRFCDTVSWAQRHALDIRGRPFDLGPKLNLEIVSLNVRAAGLLEGVSELQHTGFTEWGTEDLQAYW